MRPLLLTTCTLFWSLIGLQATAAPTNFIVVLIDDLGWRDFSCFGNPDADTPSIDRLAAEGLRFSQFYVNAPICSPSRTALTTGCYPQRYRIGSYLDNRQRNRKRGIANWLDPRTPTLARALQSAGYATGHFGKWHMGGQRDVGNAPLITEYGFDESLTNFEGLGDRVLPLLVRPSAAQPEKYALGSDRLGRGEIEWRDRAEVTTAFVDGAIEFIDRARTANKPFYINLWPDDVHSPFTPPLEQWGDGKKRTLYLAVLKAMDRQLGKLFDYVRNEPGLRENTLILVCSDNGPEPGAGSAGEFRGHKGLLYEGGIRSPLIVWSPGRMESSKLGEWNRESVLAAIDVAPSLIRMADIDLPKDWRPDGEELSEVFVGRSTKSRSQPLFYRRPPDRDFAEGEPDAPDLAVRSGKWKLLCEYDGSVPQFYDLVKDAREVHNVSAKHPKIVADLTEQLLEWHRSLPVDRGEKLGSPGRRRGTATPNLSAH